MQEIMIGNKIRHNMFQRIELIQKSGAWLLAAQEIKIMYEINSNNYM